MTLRSRILDMLPALVVFAVVAAFSTFVLVEFVVRDPVVVPPPQTVSPLDPGHIADMSGDPSNG